jgi:hypothetical protein
MGTMNMRVERRRFEQMGIVDTLWARCRRMALAFGVVASAAPLLVGCATDISDDADVDDGTVDAFGEDGETDLAQSEDALSSPAPSCVERAITTNRATVYTTFGARSGWRTSVRLTNRCSRAVRVKVDFALARDSACTVLWRGTTAYFAKETTRPSPIGVNGIRYC